MLCEKCLKYLSQKIQPDDLKVLVHLNTIEANLPQFSLSRQTVQEETELSIHISSGCLQRLETLDLIGVARIKKSKKYYISSNGIKVLSIFEESIK